MQYPIYLGCSPMQHRLLGIHAVVNARGGELWRNDFDDESRHLRLDANRIRDRLQRRVILRPLDLASRFWRRARNRARIEHLLAIAGEY